MSWQRGQHGAERGEHGQDHGSMRFECRFIGYKYRSAHQLVYVNENKVWFGPVLNRPAARNTPRSVANSFQHFPARNGQKFWPLSKKIRPFCKISIFITILLN
jgi:hypothetical protein